ncbi:ketosteroid isomerase [Achromobacter sp. DMS1]|uniref:nuclear transport factor 2 family protein n=1 Tax=Achromobacter sp. DMS1 TaxID=1688405 RepID=UPI00069F147B|nr:nuclear transport factor 2 family protein [Achromobacter sp. DMS1]KOF54681.1 ketosteroid isomerase [Achromobacter sp. DMS1]KOF55114.1 ketosteroid isomerase [Achromobacter sp. DMS1]
MSKLKPEQMEATIRRYFDACNAADYEGLVSCFTPDAVHYFPPGLPDIPWRGAETIAKKWIWCVETLGSQWTIEKVLCSSTVPEAVIEWTHWKNKIGKALRGDEWYVFDEKTGRIREIRAYYASPADPAAAICQLHEFDYAGRGYHLAAPRTAED